jgi:predicted nucleic acid-binding protein
VIVVSDTNVLSSLAAGDAFPLLLQLFARSQMCVPPSVCQELQTGLDTGKMYLELVLQAIATRQIEVLALSHDEEQVLHGYPHKLNLGERQAIALTQIRHAILLSNDKRAVRYCQQQNIRVVNLVDILRLLWIRRVVSQDEVRTIIEKMRIVENLTLTPVQQAVVFAPPRRR